VDVFNLCMYVAGNHCNQMKSGVSNESGLKGEFIKGR